MASQFQSYTQEARVVTAFQLPWAMTITVNGTAISGIAGQWLVVPPPGEVPYFMNDMDFEAKYTVVEETV